MLVTALAECIHIVPKAASVDLSTGDKGIVLIENTRDFMRPVVLRLSDNQIYDLSDKKRLSGNAGDRHHENHG